MMAQIYNDSQEFGEKLVKFFDLKPVKDNDGKRYNPDRYYTVIGTKTAKGLALSLELFTKMT